MRTVAFESSNTMTNVGSAEWTARNRTRVRLDPGDVQSVVGDDHRPALHARPRVDARANRKRRVLGKVPGDRLIVKDSAVFFRGDGQFRSKSDLSPRRALPIAASYDASQHVLTLVQYTRPADAPAT